MPKIGDLSNSKYIDSPEDIPEEYRKRIERGEKINIEETPITSGRRGKIIENDSDISQEFGEESFYYIAHGTNGGNDVVDSILEGGLKAKNGAVARRYFNTLRGLESTSVDLGFGSTSLYYENKNDLDHWPHKNSRNIIIVSIPSEFIVDKFQNNVNDSYDAYLIGDEERGYVLRPEFIKGVYNADTNTFVENENYLSSLPEEKRRAILMETKQRYMSILARSSIVLPKDNPTINLDVVDLDLITVEWYREQLNKMMERENTIEEDEEFLVDDDAWGEWFEDVSESEFNGMTKLVKSRKKNRKMLKTTKDDEEWKIEDEGWGMGDW